MRAWVGVLALSVIGCGTSSGNPVDGDDSDDPKGERGPTSTDNGIGAHYGCEPHPSKVGGADTVTPLGFSADDVLAFAAGTHESTIRWQPSGLVSYGPESGEHAFTLTVRYAGGEIRYLTYTEKAASSSGNDISTAIDSAVSCDSIGLIEIDVEVEVTTDGGALAERTKGTLFASSRNWAELLLPLEEGKLGGDFAVSETRPVGGKLVQFKLSIGLSPLGLRGTLDGLVEFRMGDSVSAAVSREPLAQVGDAVGCEQAGLPVEIDQSIGGLSAQAAFDAVAAIGRPRASWFDGSTTDVSLRLTHDGGAVCAVIDPSSLPRPTDAGQLRLSGRLAATSADGRLDADWPVTVEVLGGEDGEISEVNVLLDHARFGTIPGSQLAQVYGVPDLQLTGFDGYLIGMELRVMVEGGEPAPSFALHIRGLRNQPCEPVPPPPDSGEPGGSSSPGCRGQEMTELESLTF